MQGISFERSGGFAPPIEGDRHPAHGRTQNGRLLGPGLPAGCRVETHDPTGRTVGKNQWNVTSPRGASRVSHPAFRSPDTRVSSRIASEARKCSQRLLVFAALRSVDASARFKTRVRAAMSAPIAPGSCDGVRISQLAAAAVAGATIGAPFARSAAGGVAMLRMP